MVMVILSALVERFSVSRMRDFYIYIFFFCFLNIIKGSIQLARFFSSPKPDKVGGGGGAAGLELKSTTNIGEQIGLCRKSCMKMLYFLQLLLVCWTIYETL